MHHLSLLCQIIFSFFYLLVFFLQVFTLAGFWGQQAQLVRGWLKYTFCWLSVITEDLEFIPLCKGNCSFINGSLKGICQLEFLAPRCVWAGSFNRWKKNISKKTVIQRLGNLWVAKTWVQIQTPTQELSSQRKTSIMFTILPSKIVDVSAGQCTQHFILL